MPEGSTIGDRLRQIRREHGLSQEDLAGRAGLSKDLIAKLEQNRRTSCRITSLMRLANALDVDLTELTGKRERLGTERDGGSVLAIRDVLLSPSLLPGLPGLDADDAGLPTPLPELRKAVGKAWDNYWTGDFGALTAAVPGLIAETRLTRRSLGVAAVPVLAQAYQLAACLLLHLGKTDLAMIGAERGIIAAAEGDDQLQWAAVQATYAWVMEYQGRLAESEDLSVRVAQQIEPSFSSPAVHLAVWGNLLISAIGAAALRTKPVTDYVAMAAAGAERIGSTIAAYRTTFGASKVVVNEVHALTLLKEPGTALKAARRVHVGDLPRIAHGHHLLDMAQAHVDARQYGAAERRLEEARGMSPVWFRQQTLAQTIVTDIREKQTRPSSVIRSLARSVGLD